MNKESINFLSQVFLTDCEGNKSRIIKIGNDKKGKLLIYTASKQNIKDGICTRHTISESTECELPE